MKTCHQFVPLRSVCWLPAVCALGALSSLLPAHSARAQTPSLAFGLIYEDDEDGGPADQGNRQQNAPPGTFLSDSYTGAFSSASGSASYNTISVRQSAAVPASTQHGYGAAGQFQTYVIDYITINAAPGTTGTLRQTMNFSGSATGTFVNGANIGYIVQVTVQGGNQVGYSYGDFGNGMLTDMPAPPTFTVDGTFQAGQTSRVDTVLNSQCDVDSSFGSASGDVTATLSKGGYELLDANGQDIDYSSLSSGGSGLGLTIPASAPFSTFTLTNQAPGSLGTLLSILDGSASTQTQLRATFISPLEDPVIKKVSDTVDFVGTNSDPVVLQLSYDPATAQSLGLSEAALRLIWRDPATQQLVNAVLGNSSGIPLLVQRAYNPATDFHLGTFGIDTANHVVWAVVNHRGEFAVAMVADPVAASPAFFAGATALSNGVYYLQFPNGIPFGYYSYLVDPAYIFHFDLGYEYVFDAKDGNNGVYFYDFKSNDFFYTSPGFPFPYLYDFGLNSTVYYYPDPNNPGRYNTDGVRYFYVFNTGGIISK